MEPVYSKGYVIYNIMLNVMCFSNRYAITIYI